MGEAARRGQIPNAGIAPADLFEDPHLVWRSSSKYPHPGRRDHDGRAADEDEPDAACDPVDGAAQGADS
jgi:hypothetical protein